MKKQSKFGFSLIELSVVILIIGVLVLGVTQGSRMMSEASLKSARSITISSPVASIDGLVLWLEPTMAKSLQNSNNSFDLSDGDQIKNWIDINPQNTTPFTATESTKMPTYKKNGIGGLPTLFFDASSNGSTGKTLQIPYSKSLNSNEFTIFVVSQLQERTTDYRSIIDNRDDGALSGYVFYSVDSSYNIMYGFNGSSWNDIFTSSGSSRQNKADITELHRSSTKSTCYINGSMPSLSSGTNPNTNPYLANATHSFQIGALNNQFYFDGYISEIIVFNRALQDQERKSVEGYLAQKYKINLS